MLERQHTNTPVIFRTACQQVHGNSAMLHIQKAPQKNPHQIMWKLNTSVPKFEVVKYRKIKALRFLGAFAKLRKATISFIMSVRPSEWNNSAPNKTDFHEIWYLNIFRNYIENIQVSSKSDKNNGYFT